MRPGASASAPKSSSGVVGRGEEGREVFLLAAPLAQSGSFMSTSLHRDTVTGAGTASDPDIGRKGSTGQRRNTACCAEHAQLRLAAVPPPSRGAHALQLYRYQQHRQHQHQQHRNALRAHPSQSLSRPSPQSSSVSLSLVRTHTPTSA